MFLLRAAGTAVFSIIALFILTRIVGNKQLSQMNMFDYVNGITIGSIAAELAIADEFKQFIVVLIAMTVYSMTAFLISIVTIKSIKLRRLLSGKAMILIEKGTIYKCNLKKCKLDLNDVLTLARNQGYFNIAQIEYAIMENNGKVSFLPTPDNKPVTCSDMNIVAQSEGLVCNVIIDGKLLPQNLRHTGMDVIWLENQMKSQGYNDFSQIMLATVDSSSALSIYPMVKEENQKNVYD